MRGQSYCDTCQEFVEATCPEGHQLPIIGLTVDVIVEHEKKLVLVKRSDRGWALPGGYVEYDESLESAAIREVQEELGASRVGPLTQFHTYGDPDRDQGRRNVSVVYTATVDNVLPISNRSEQEQRKLQDEGIQDVQTFAVEQLPPLAFDHRKIVEQYLLQGRKVRPYLS